MRRRTVRIVVGVLLAAGMSISSAGTATGADPASGDGEPPASVQARQAEANAERSPLDDIEASRLAEAGSGRGREAIGVTVTPDTGLVHGDEVTIHGTGWQPHDFVIGVLCAPGVPIRRGCESLGQAESSFGRVGAQGRFTVSGPVDVIIDTLDGPVDCRVVACLVGALSEFRAAQAFVPVAFDPGGPDPERRTITVSPDTGLVDGDRVTVTGDGFPQADPGFGVAEVTPCRTPVVSWDDCDRGETQELFVEGSGQLDGTIFVTPILHLPGGDVDCRTIACALTAQPETWDFEDRRGELSEAAIAPIAFEPGGAIRPAPSLTADPSTDLRDGDAVRLQAEGFDPGRGFTISQCRAGATSSRDCENDILFFGVSDSDSFEFWYPLRARFPDGAGHVVDCRTEPCSIVVAHGNFGRHAEAVLEFDPDAPLLAPTIEVSPSTGLTDGDVVSVTGSGFPSASVVEITQCPAKAFDSFDCSERDGTFVETPPFEREELQAVRVPRTRAEAEAVAPEAATISATLTVHSTVRSFFDESTDCTVDPCVVLAEAFGGPSARAPIGFVVAPISATPPFTG